MIDVDSALPGTVETTARKHVLLTSLGMQAHENEYELERKTVTARLSPLALIGLLDKLELPKPDHAIAVVTRQVAGAEVWEIFQQGIDEKIGPDRCSSIVIPDGNSAEDINYVLEQVAAGIPEDADLTLDVTQGLRFLPFMFYALALYLKSLRNVTIRGAYYGMVEGRAPTDVKPIVDLRPLLELPEWFHAVRMFRDLGTTAPMVRLATPLVDVLKRKAQRALTASASVSKKAKAAVFQPAGQLQSVVNGLERHAFAYESGLPLELGLADERLGASLGDLDPDVLTVLPPLAGALTTSIADAAGHSALGSQISSRGLWKTNIALDAGELERQARTLDLYVQRGQIPLAVGQMREWVVSWAVLQSRMEKSWLDRDTRTRIERRLGALAAFVRSAPDSATAEQQRFGDFWNQLTDQFDNEFHHHGMRETEVKPKDLDAVLCFWEKLKAGAVEVPPLGGDGSRLLLSPQGNRRGVLFSALKKSQPAYCVVVCAAGTASSVDEAAREAGFEGYVKKITLDDERAGFGEMDAVADEASDWLLNADEVVANVTGGTTLMRLTIQRLAEDAARLDRPVRRFALIDRRTRDEQDDRPYVESDCHWLDP